MNRKGAIGFDFGGQYAVIAVARPDGVDIVMNEGHQRETPVVVGFGDHERMIGEQGFVQLKSNFKRTVTFPNRFLGMAPNSPLLNEERKWVYTPIVTTKEDRLAFEIENSSGKKQYLPEQVVAMLLRKTADACAKQGYSAQEMVISVPCYYTEKERKALIAAAQIAQIRVGKLINESTATAVSYGFFRRKELKGAPRNVCFVSLGHCNGGAYIGAFTDEKTSVVNQIQERNLGTRDFDWRLLEFYAQMIKEKYGANVMSNNKVRLRLLDAIEKQRKVLSANSDASINVDNIVDDCDLSYNLTREKFEEIIAPDVERFRNMLINLRKQMKGQLHSVEIIGGGTRIPIIQKIIKDVFGMEISRTLNGSESIARGCAVQALLLNDLSRYGIEELNTYPISLSWEYRKDLSMEIESSPNTENESVIFPEGCQVPNAISLTFDTIENIDLKLCYQNAPAGTDPFLARYIIHSKVPKSTKSAIKVRIALNLNGLVELDQAQMVEYYAQDNLAPVKNFFGSIFGSQKQEPSPNKFKDPRDIQQQEDEVQKNQKTHTTNLEVDAYSFETFNPKEIGQFITEEANLHAKDRMISDAYEKKNELESYVYEFKRKVHEKYEKMLSPQGAQNLLRTLEGVEQWLYEEGATTTKAEYQRKLDELRSEMRSLETGQKK